MKPVEKPITHIGPNKCLVSHVLMSAGNAANTFKGYPGVKIKGGIIDDETLGIDTLAELSSRLLACLKQLGDNNGKGQNIYLTPIAPGEDVINWANANFEKIGETFVLKDKYVTELRDEIVAMNIDLDIFEQHIKNLFAGRIFSSKKGTLAIAVDVIDQYVAKTNQALADKDVTAKELSDQMNVVGNYIMTNFPDDIAADDTKDGSAMDIILNLLADLKLKRAVCDDAMKQFNEAYQQAEELKKQLTEKDSVLGQARENLSILQPHPGNFDQLLTLVLQYVVNSRKLLTEDQRKLLSSINALI